METFQESKKLNYLSETGTSKIVYNWEALIYKINLNLQKSFIKMIQNISDCSTINVELITVFVTFEFHTYILGKGGVRQSNQKAKRIRAKTFWNAVKS